MINVACSMHVCTLKRPCSTLGRAKYMATRTNVHKHDYCHNVAMLHACVHLEKALQHIRQGEVGPQLFITDVVAVLT